MQAVADRFRLFRPNKKKNGWSSVGRNEKGRNGGKDEGGEGVKGPSGWNGWMKARVAK